MKHYTQLSEKERHQLEILVFRGEKPAQIAKILGRHRSTINRELKRGRTFKNLYFSDMTIRERKEKLKNTRRKRKTDMPEIQQYIKEKLELRYSPEIISARMEKDIGYYVCPYTIYSYAYRNQELAEKLPRAHKGRLPRKYTQGLKKELIPNRVDIKERPKEANERKEFGHFEADTVLSCKGSLSALLVAADRKTRKTKIRKLTRKTSSQASSQIIFALNEYNVSHIHTITYDNGCENTKHEDVNKVLQMQSYFCEPYHAWEKGMVENINGLIRWWFPKKTDFDTITEEEIQEVEDWINNRPMRELKYKTPNEAYEEEMQRLENEKLKICRTSN